MAQREIREISRRVCPGPLQFCYRMELPISQLLLLGVLQQCFLTVFIRLKIPNPRGYGISLMESNSIFFTRMSPIFTQVDSGYQLVFLFFLDPPNCN